MTTTYIHKVNKICSMHKRLMSIPLERYGLTVAQYQALAVAVEYPGITAKEMLHYLDTDKATLSGVLKRLERRGLLRRTPNENDRRLLHVEPNDSSRVICERMKAFEARIQEDLFEGLKAKEIRIHNDVTERIIEKQLKQSNSIKDEEPV